MASPLRTAKQTVNLTAPARVSRIRRDPPPVVKKVDPHVQRERDKRAAIIGIVALALALVILLFAASLATGWSPAQYTLAFEV